MNPPPSLPPGPAPPARGWLSRLIGGSAAGGEARFVLLALGAALLLRALALALAIRTGRWEIAWDEIHVAQCLDQGRGFAFDYYGMFGGGDRISCFFPPLYAYDVALLLRVFHSVLAVAYENLLLSLGVALALYVFARRLFDVPTARVTLALAAVYPPFITRIPHGVVLYPKMLLMVLLVMALHRVWTRERAADAALTGLWAGLLALTMTDALVYLGLAAAALLLARARSLGHRLRAGALMLAVAALTIAPWTARNWVTFHRFCLISSNGGFNLYMGNHEDAPGEVDFPSIVRLDERLGGALARTDELGRNAILYRESVRWMRREPARAAWNLLVRGVMHWGFHPSNVKDMGLMPGQRPTRNPVYPLYLWSYALAYLAVLALAVPGFLRCRRRWGELTPLWLTFVYSTAIAALFMVQTKMRLAKVEPFLIVFAAHYLAQRLAPATGDAATPPARAARGAVG